MKRTKTQGRREREKAVAGLCVGRETGRGREAIAVAEGGGTSGRGKVGE